MTPKNLSVQEAENSNQNNDVPERPIAAPSIFRPLKICFFTRRKSLRSKDLEKGAARIRTGKSRICKRRLAEVATFAQAFVLQRLTANMSAYLCARKSGKQRPKSDIPERTHLGTPAVLEPTIRAVRIRRKITATLWKIPQAIGRL